MPNDLPLLVYEDLQPTRDYLQAVAKVLGKLQQAFLAKSPRDWQYGLEVTMRGITTQTFNINGQETRALLDLVKHKVRFGDRNWVMRSTTPAELFKDIQAMLDVELAQPDFTAGVLEYDDRQASNYAMALWWMQNQFDELRKSLTTGATSPILLYPHHFDLSLAWFPHDDDEQIGIGFSTGDETIAEPYIYMTAYPDADKIKNIDLPAEAHWQTDGFTGIVLPYANLQKNASPAKLSEDLAQKTLRI